MSDEIKSVPSVSVNYASNGSSTKANEFGMRPMQERAFEKRGEQYLLIKSPPASGKSRAPMFIALTSCKIRASNRPSSAAGSRTTPNGWESCSSFIRR